MDETDARLKAELESMHQKQTEIEDSMNKFGNADRMKAEIMAKQRELVDKRERLEVDVPRAESEASRLSTEIASLNNRLSDNSYYHRVSSKGTEDCFFS